MTKSLWRNFRLSGRPKANRNICFPTSSNGRVGAGLIGKIWWR